MTHHSPLMRPATPPRGAQPRNRFLIALLALALLAFLASLPWQVRNWREAAALRQDAARQQARLQQLQRARAPPPPPPPPPRAAPPPPPPPPPRGVCGRRAG